MNKEKLNSFRKLKEELEAIVDKRGTEFIIAKRMNFYGTFNGGYIYDFYTEIKYEDDELHLKFTEKTPHDCPDSGYITVPDDFITMSDKEWNHKIKSIEKEYKKNLEESLKKDKELELKKKKEQYEKLKDELGYD